MDAHSDNVSMMTQAGHESNAAARGNLAELLPDQARRHGAKSAIIGAKDRISFQDLAEEAARVAATLRARGVEPGDRVLIFVPMSIALYAALLGTFHAGAVAVFVDAWADRSRLDAAVAAAKPKAFIGSLKAQALRLLSPAIRRIPIHLLACRYSRATGAGPEPVTAAATALVTFTTGSTGAPKGAARSHGLLWAQHQALQAHLQLQPDDVDMPALPVFVLNNLALGIPSVLPDFDPRKPADFDPARVLAQMDRDGVTTSGGSPAFFQRLAEHAASTRRKLPLRALFTGGAPVLPPLAHTLRNAVSGKAHVVYGSTEVEPVSGIEMGEMLDLVRAAPRGYGLCVGRPVDGLDLRIIRPHDAPIELGEGGWGRWDMTPGEGGEVTVAGGHVLHGYLDHPEADRAQKIRDGDRLWHRTGDAARLDAEGRLWLLGRVSRRVRTGRATHQWPLPVEMAALNLAGIRHAAYFGRRRKDGLQDAILCLEGETIVVPTLAARAVSAPVDEVHVLPRIPRDPRHESKTDMEKLTELIPPPERQDPVPSPPRGEGTG